MTTAADRVVYTCQRCLGPVRASDVHQKLVRLIEREQVGRTGRRTITVQASELVEVTHLAPCTPTTNH